MEFDSPAIHQWADSSMAERFPLKESVVGSTPTRLTNMGVW